MAEGGRIGSEAELIAAYLAPLAADNPGALGLRDDCATLVPPPGRELVLTTDSLIEGVHFLAGDIPAYKALAVNVSDLAAKGAEPLAYLLTLALPEAPTHAWMRSFADGLARAQRAFGCLLAGGDTDRTPGRLTITIAAIGSVPAGRMVRRTSARAGDRLYVSGTIGDAWLGLEARRHLARAGEWGLDERDARLLVERFEEPVPRLGLREALLEHASAALDVSDGLVKDLNHLCRASSVGGRLELARVPLSEPARRLVASGSVALAQLVTGGEDYEVLAAVPAEQGSAFERRARAAGVDVTAIGTLLAPAEGVTVLGQDGHELELGPGGWEHFGN
ncbi:MAG: thiamine-phosphate kinase [Pseudomonadota bacterium]